MEGLLKQSKALLKPQENEALSPELKPRNKEITLFSRRGKKEDKLQCKYDASLADAALRQASNAGFLVSPSKSLLLKRFQDDDEKIPSLKEIKFIHLTHHRIRTLGHIQSCHFLTICILHNNYLTRFSALENCPFLKRLDLHSNQIVKLPDVNFWMEMTNLLVLNLHDNGIGKLTSIQPLSNCHNLAALTLYDTPLSLKPSYRHHIVNSIWSLKALDHHVIGDDEIIEDAVFTKRFSALNPFLYVDLCPKEDETDSDTPRTYKMENGVLTKILSDINLRLRHGSPVVVIQRWMRGHLARKRLNMNYTEIISRLKKLNLLPAHPSGLRHDTQAEEAFSLDYDTYLKNRRPGSKTPSASTTLRAETPSKSDGIEDKTSEFEMKLPPQLQINLEKLEQNSDRNFGSNLDQNITIYVQKDPALPAKSLFSKSLKVSIEKESSGLNLRSMFAAADPPSDAARNAIVHQIPGELPTNGGDGKQAEKKDVAIQCGSDPEVPNHVWRIHDKKFEVLGERPVVDEFDPVHNHVISNRESGRNVREAIEYWHDCEISSPTRKIIKSKSPSKLKDTVSLATLMAVTKAYRDRDRSDSIAMKVDRVMRIQQERMQSRQIVAAYKDEKRLAALSQRQEDRIRVAETIQQVEANKSAYLEYAQERKQRSMQRHQKFNKEFLFSADFNNQHISVSNALIRHDRQTAKEDMENEKTEITNSVKNQLFEQAQMVKRYMEHKQLVNQLNASKEKAQMDARVLQDGNERFMKSRQRVANMKAKKAAIQSYHHSLPATTNAGMWSLTSPRDAGQGSPSTGLKHSSSVLPPIDDFQGHAGVPTSVVRSSSIPLPPVPTFQPVSVETPSQPSKNFNPVTLPS